MRLARFNVITEPVSCARTGVVLPNGFIADLRAGVAKFLLEKQGDVQGREIAALRVPADIRQILHVGAPALDLIRKATEWLSALHTSTPDARGPDGEVLFVPGAEARLHNPVKPWRILAVDDNTARAGLETSPNVRSLPAAAIMGPVRDLNLPAKDARVLYGTGLAAVMGRNAHGIGEQEAAAAIAGYTVANIVVETGAPVMGDLGGATRLTRCIIGPHLVMAGSVDPGSLAMETRVNGVCVQSGTTAELAWSFPKLIARLSRNGLEAGDVIVTGLLSDAQPAGVNGRPLLAPGDVLESEIERVGVMRNRVVA
jgi:2-keto-4-pentenoate hydratase/2-oxohepta-3-ene-1,7-dioic acid hydratase in catechol pathway